MRIGLRVFRWNVDAAVRMGFLPDLGHHELWLLDDMLRAVRKMGLSVESYPSAIRAFPAYEPVVVEAQPNHTLGQLGFHADLYAKHTKRSEKKSVAPFFRDRRTIAAADGLVQAAGSRGRLGAPVDPLSAAASRKKVIHHPAL